MAHHNFLGRGTPVAQQEKITVVYGDGLSTYEITIGGIQIDVPADTDLATTRAAIVTALNDSAEPYFSVLTISNGTASGEILIDADVAGFPFVMTVDKTGGTGTIAIVNVTASSGPHHWNDASNWDSDAVPTGSADTVTIANSAVDILFGLDQSAVQLTMFAQKASYTGKIGLDTRSFYKGEGVSDATRDEYRDTYLKIKYDKAVFGELDGQTTVTGCPRCKVWNPLTDVSLTAIYETAAIASETNMMAFRFRFANTGADVQILGKASGGVGFGTDLANEVCIMGEVWISKVSSLSKVIMGDAATYESFESYGGTHRLKGNMNASKVLTVHAGTVTTEGESTNGVPAIVVEGGSVIANHNKASQPCTATVTINGGTIDATQNNTARTWTAVNLNGGKLIGGEHLTITDDITLPSSRYELTMVA